MFLRFCSAVLNKCGDPTLENVFCFVSSFLALFLALEPVLFGSFSGRSLVVYGRKLVILSLKRGGILNLSFLVNNCPRDTCHPHIYALPTRLPTFVLRFNVFVVFW